MKEIKFPELLKIIKEFKLDIKKTKISNAEVCPFESNTSNIPCSFFNKTYNIFDLFEHFKYNSNKSHLFKVISLSKNKIYLPIKCVVTCSGPCTLIINTDISIQYQLNLFERKK